MRIIKSHGESGDADMLAVAQELPNIQNVIENTTERIFIMPMNVGCFYKLAPETTVATKELSGRKKMKDRKTLLVCANAEGSDRNRIDDHW